MSELEIEAALRQLVDMVRRMDPDFTAALQRAEDCLDILDELQ